MRVVLASLGTLGDLHPFVAVALELRAAGFTPVLAAAEDSRPIADRHGLAFHPVGPTAARILEDTGLDEGAVTRAIAGDFGFITEKVVLPYASQTLADLARVMADADLAVCSTYAVLGRIAAAAAGVPLVSLLLQPLTLFSAEDPPVAPGGSALLPWLRRHLGPWAVRPLLELARSATRRQLKPFAALRAAAGAPPFTGAELIDGPLSAEQVFALWSPELAPLPRDTPSNVAQAGFCFYDAGFAGAGISAELDRFLAHGPPPLVFTLGSLAVYAEDGFYAASVQAARQLGRRAVLLVGDALVDRHRDLAAPDVAVVGYAPHSAVFGRAAAVVHHGGAGAIAQALKAGAPQLVCPMFGDQFDNAARLERRGVALVVRKPRYTAERAAAKLGRLLAEPAFANTAAQIAPRVAAENGAAFVAEAIGRRFGARCSAEALAAGS